MRVAIVHDWLTGMRGGERCLEVFCELFPTADLFTLLHVKGSVSPAIEAHRIVTSWVQRLPFAASRYRHYLPLFPRAIESLSLRGYDLVLSSSHCVAKGARADPGAIHVSYIHAPMRYVWDQYESYFGPGRADGLTAAGMRLVRRYLQRWDVRTASRPHRLIANSRNIAAKIQRYYRRDSVVVYPPVNWDAFVESPGHDDFYLMVTAFAPYKRVDIAIQACTRLKRRLTIIGAGQDEARLRALAGNSVTFLGWQPDDVVRAQYRRCRALLFPGEEDFGIVPLEVMASGKPVIAYGKGGALETVVPINPIAPAGPGHHAPTGVFFCEQSAEAMTQAIEAFERAEQQFDPAAIRAHVEPFGRSHFKANMRHIIDSSLSDPSAVAPC